MTRQDSSAAYMRNGREQVPVVCVGLSSRGIRRLRTIFQQLSPATGMAFVIIPHLSRTHPTLLPELLSYWTPMPAQLADPGLTIEPNHIYVIPPGQDVLVRGRTFRHTTVIKSERLAKCNHLVPRFARQMAKTRRHRGDSLWYRS
jgi:chemotaxis response regulator CheB